MVQATTLFGLNFNVPLASLTNHNTSAYPAYNETNFAANFGTNCWINQNGTTMPVDPTLMDESLNPNTPGHVSHTDVHTLIPSRPDLRWFANGTCWFGTSSHITIGVTNNSTTYVAAMISDLESRGFNGIILSWYGMNASDGTDGVTQKIKAYLSSSSNTNKNFHYIIMIVDGITGGESNANLETNIVYCQNQYFSDTNYEHEPVTNGQPILMFFNVRNTIGEANMEAIKAATATNTIWVEQGTSYLSEPWENESFQWTDEYDTGVNNSDPFNLTKVTSEFGAIASSGKKAFGAMCGRFNGTLTKTVGWSLGKYLPCSNGLCEVERASSINSAIPSNMTRMQWATWSDWEEGTQVESGIENYFALTAQVGSSNTLSWTITSGDERTVDHYEIYASADGVNSAFLGSVPTGTYQTNLSQVAFTSGTYQVYVDAVAKPCIRDHMSPPASLSVSASPVVVQSPTSLTVSYGGTAVFNVGVAGSSPFSYLWYDQNNNLVGTNSSLVISNATHGNKYFVTVTNPYGTNSSTAAVLTVTYSPVVLTDVQPLFQTNWQSDPVSLSVAATGVPPLSYQWTLNGHNITRATNSAYSFAALAGTNFYKVTIKNNYGSANSSTGLVVGLAATFPNLSNYNGMPITFSGYTNGATLLDFPVLIRLSTNIPGFSYAQFIAPSNGADLRFTSEAGRQLFFQIDQWNPAGESQIWVQVPSLSSSNDYITACWGNAADSALLPCNTNGATWTTLSGSNNFTLAYHLSQSGFPYADATLQYPALSGVAPSLTNGMIGNGCAFNGASQFLDAGLVNIGKTFTLSAWVKIAPAATSEQTIWCNKSGGWNTAGFDFYVNSWQTNDGIIYFDTADGVTGSVAPRTATHAVTFGQWHLLSGTMDGVNGSVHVYVDGIDETITNAVDTAFQVTNYVRCGSLLTGTPGATGNVCFNGSMDEVRIENGVRSPAWVWASWATVAESNFATYGSIAPINIALNWQMISSQLVLTWTSGALQSASAVTGPYTNISGATSPYTNVPSAAQQYFRVKVQ